MVWGVVQDIIIVTVSIIMYKVEYLPPSFKLGHGKVR